MNYRFHPGAQAEHLDTVVFYESQRKGLGAAYVEAFETMMNHVVESPYRYHIERKPNIRVVSITKFPYKIIFRDEENDIQVLAVSHKKRRPDYWLSRL
jgi:plasmid stabilization system protein ParE